MEYSPVTVAETESFQRKAGRLLSGNEKDVLDATLFIGAFWEKRESQYFEERGKYLVQDGQRSREILESKAMSKAFEEISTGLEEAIKHAKSKRGKIVVHEPETINVKAIRAKTGMSQQRFCATFGISLGTLRHWEQGLRSPRGPARILLKVVDNDPKAVIRAIDQ